MTTFYRTNAPGIWHDAAMWSATNGGVGGFGIPDAATHNVVNESSAITYITADVLFGTFDGYGEHAIRAANDLNGDGAGITRTVSATLWRPTDGPARIFAVDQGQTLNLFGTFDLTGRSNGQAIGCAGGSTIRLVGDVYDGYFAFIESGDVYVTGAVDCHYTNASAEFPGALSDDDVFELVYNDQRPDDPAPRVFITGETRVAEESHTYRIGHPSGFVQLLGPVTARNSASILEAGQSIQTTGHEAQGHIASIFGTVLLDGGGKLLYGSLAGQTVKIYGRVTNNGGTLSTGDGTLKTFGLPLRAA